MSEGETKSDNLLVCSHCSKPGSSVFAGGRYEPGCDMWHPRCFAIAVGSGLEESLGTTMNKSEARGYLGAVIDMFGQVPKYKRNNTRYLKIVSYKGQIVAKAKVALKVLELPHSVAIVQNKIGVQPDLCLMITGGLRTWEKLAKVPCGTRDSKKKIEENLAGYRAREHEKFLKWKAKGFKGRMPRMSEKNDE